MFAFLAGWRLYALVGIGLAFLALAGVICVQRLEHKADVASLALAKQNLESVSNALKQSEADKADLARKAQELDAAIKERDSRLRALNETKRKLADELDRIKKALPAPDQGCLSRDPSFLPFLTSCATDPLIVTKTVQAQVPESLFLPCNKSQLAGTTYQDGLALAINRGLDLDECNRRLEDIHKYVSPAP
jgi:hypothetical protein